MGLLFYDCLLFVSYAFAGTSCAGYCPGMVSSACIPNPSAMAIPGPIPVRKKCKAAGNGLVFSRTGYAAHGSNNRVTGAFFSPAFKAAL